MNTYKASGQMVRIVHQLRGKHEIDFADIVDIQFDTLILKDGRKFEYQLNLVDDVAFNIASVTKDDLVNDLSLGFTKEEIDSLDSDDMKMIASELGDDYVEQLYWSSLKIITRRILDNK
jgi:hypothetical protein